MHILYLFSHCVSFALLIIDFIVILHVRLIRVLLKINQSLLIFPSLFHKTVEVYVQMVNMKNSGASCNTGISSYGKRKADH